MFNTLSWHIYQVKLISWKISAMSQKSDTYNTRKDYSAYGLIEALLAIVVIGIASVSFLAIATDAIREQVVNDRYDILTQEAKTGAELVRQIASLDENGNQFPALERSIGNCYHLIGDLDNPALYGPPPNFNVACTYLEYKNGSCSVLSAYYPELGANPTPQQTLVYDSVYRLFCVPGDLNDEDNDFVVGKVITGYRECRSDTSDASCTPPDFEYLVTVKLD